MKKNIYAVMCETRKRESEEPWRDAYLVYCTDTMQEAKKDCEKFNNKKDFKNRFLEEHYYFEEISLFIKD